MITNCTRCSKPLDDIKVMIKLSVEVERLQSSGVWEEIPNSKLTPQETLCPDCFDKFSEVLTNEMSIGE